MTATVTKEAIATATQTFPTRRFHMPDIQETTNWLVPKLAAKWVHWQPAQVLGWFRGITDSSEFHFIRTDNVVGLAQIIHEKFNPKPVVREVFVCVKPIPDSMPRATQEDKEVMMRLKEQHLLEGAGIYDDFFRWAFNLQAGEFQLAVPRQFDDIKEDIPKEMMKRRFGSLMERGLVFSYIK